jgi:hypothetical protein
MNNLKIHSHTTLGYCLECNRACTVAHIKLPQWEHKYPICEMCLDKIKSKIQSDGIQLMENERNA